MVSFNQFQMVFVNILNFHPKLFFIIDLYKMLFSFHLAFLQILLKNFIILQVLLVLDHIFLMKHLYNYNQNMLKSTFHFFIILINLLKEYFNYLLNQNLNILQINQIQSILYFIHFILHIFILNLILLAFLHIHIHKHIHIHLLHFHYHNHIHKHIHIHNHPHHFILFIQYFNFPQLIIFQNQKSQN